MSIESVITHGWATKISAAIATAMLLTGVVLSTAPAVVSAQAKSNQLESGVDSGGLALEISPSPLIATIKPGTTTTLELRIRNTGNIDQELRMGMRTFSIDDTTGKVNLGKDVPKDVEKFVSFSEPTFTLQPGEIKTQTITINTPQDAGFTYSFATVVSQTKATPKTKSTASIQGTVADFTLLQVDRPGAVRGMKITKFTASKHIYEFLPASFSLVVSNTGNTLVQPKGTVYIQRSLNDQKPLAAISLNEAGGYILPKASRNLTMLWKDGFPHFATQGEQQVVTGKLEWGQNVSKLRFGRYIAKVVAIYDDGQRDVPMTASLTFWVIPWRILAVIVVIMLLLGVGVYTTFRNSSKVLIRKRHAKRQVNDTSED